jgi:hypothetical protein
VDVVVVVLATFGRVVVADDGTDAEPLRAVIPRAGAPMVIDGRLDEYTQAFCTPVEYFHPDWKNRAGQFFYLWDNEAFYVGVRTLDEKPFTPHEPLWVGDAVEWYFDTRPEPAANRLAWGPGAVHCFFTALDGERLAPRFCLRPGYEDAIPATGVKVAGRRTEHGLEYEFKLPWSNFPQFHAENGATLHLDAELSYSDGVSRTFRTFVFGGPLSVERPANLAVAVLAEKFTRDDWQSGGPVMMPMRVDVPWKQDGQPHVQAMIAASPNRRAEVGRVVVQLIRADGRPIAEYAVDQPEVMEHDGNFARYVARWPASLAAHGTYHVQVVVYDAAGKELTRVTPRLASVNMEQGY